MKKSTVKVLSVGLAIAIPLTAVLLKDTFNKQEKMVATDMKKDKKISTVRVENEEYHKTIKFYSDDMYVSDLPNMYYLTKDNVNYLLCRKEVATKIDLLTSEGVVEDIYYDINNEEYITDYKKYNIMSAKDFNELYGINDLKSKTLKLTIMD